MNDKRLYRYIGLSSVYFFLTIIIFSISSYSQHWIDIWFSDRFFSFQFSIIFLIGCTIIDRHFGSLNYYRYRMRKKIITTHLISYVFLAFVLTSILFSISVFTVLLIINYATFSDLILLLDKYFRFMFGLFISGVFSLIFRYSNVKILKKAPQIYSFAIIVLELMLLPYIIKINGAKIPLFYFWIFYDKVIICYPILVVIITTLTIILYKRINKVDLTL